MRPAQEIVRFYGGTGTDDRGRSLAEVQEWPDSSLESVHDFIQWLFPLRERSGVNPRAPILDEEIIAQFRASRELQKNLMLSFVRMLRFYGLEVRHKPRLRIVQGSIFQERAREWMSPGNHNYLRITRILKSLSSLGLEEEARKFFECLSDIYDQQDKRNVLISPETFQYWKAAVPLPR